MSKLTVVIIPDDARRSRQFVLPRIAFRLAWMSSFFVVAMFGYFVCDYLELREIRDRFDQITSENEGLKGEAHVLMNNLEEVKQSLHRVQDYSTKLADITNVKVQQFSRKTGIGVRKNQDDYKVAVQEQLSQHTTERMPLGVTFDNLLFRPVFDRLKGLGLEANKQAFELQQLLSTLSQQRSLLMSVPSVSPVNGWVTSGYGKRVSPFTGFTAMHQGLDLASPVGTPIYAPADGVVIFSGKKAGFGNFIMIAHGYGVVTRYGHNAENLVQPGQRVSRGEQIATIGMTGQTTGPHLHYEVMVNGRATNPVRFILDTSFTELAAH